MPDFACEGEMTMTRINQLRETVEMLRDDVGLGPRERRQVIEELRGRDTIGEAAFWALQCERDNEDLHALPGWPECECTACGCSDPATCTDDQSVPVCGDCSEYTIDDDGDVRCSRCDDTEIISDSWGRTITRMKRPEEPTQDPDGGWACYWETVGDDGHVVGRYATQEQAEQACAAKDWPPTGDTTQYLCGYGVRRLNDAGRWMAR